jgi:hypothetical protein
MKILAMEMIFFSYLFKFRSTGKLDSLEYASYSLLRIVSGSRLS